MTLNEVQVRVLGCLMEKRRTTPDTYPLSLNSLRLACNQSTNRDPVVEYDETMIREALGRLERHGLVRLASGAGSRAAKYRHLLDDALPLSEPEHAIMCTLMLRGAQTPGELKQHAERMHEFAGLDAVHGALEGLIERELVQRLPRRPGQKEERYAHRLSDTAEDERAGQPMIASVDEEDVGASDDSSSAARELERRVAILEREVAELRAHLAAGSGAGEGAPAIGSPP